MCIHDIRSACNNKLNILARHRYMEHVEMKVTIINRSNGSAMEMNFAFSVFICSVNGIDRIRPPMKQNAKGAMLHESKENSNATGPSSTTTPNLIIKVPGCIVLDWA